MAEDAKDDEDAKKRTHSNRATTQDCCRGCHQPFIPLTNGASKTLSRVCQAELQRGYR
jgi:hypothetical protein